MTLKKRKSIAFGRALDEFDKYKKELKKLNLNEAEYNELVRKKAEELDL